MEEGPGTPPEGGPLGLSSCSPGSSRNSDVEAVLQSLPCGFLWVHRGSGGRLRKAVEKTLQALREVRDSASACRRQHLLWPLGQQPQQRRKE